MMTHKFCFNLKKVLKYAFVSKVRAVALAIGILLFYVFLSMPANAMEEKPETKPQNGSEQKGIGEMGDVVAKVNGFEITQEALKAKMLRMLAARRNGNAGEEIAAEELRKDALNKLIIMELAYQRAKAEGIKVDKDELDKAIAEIKAKVGDENYRESLEKNQATEEDLRQDLEKNLMVKYIFEKEIASQISISEDEVKKEYESIKNEFSEPEKVLVADFVLFLDDNDKSAPDKAADLIRRIKNDSGKNVLDLPSDGTFVVRELDINKNKQPELYAAAKKLSGGEVSGLIRTPDSFHIIKLLKYSPEVKAEFSQIRGFIERRVRARKQQEKMLAWESELKKNAIIEIADSPGSVK